MNKVRPHSPLQQLQEFFKSTLRCYALGEDRKFSRYWFLPKAAPGKLLVEKVIYHAIDAIAVGSRKFYF